MGSMNPFDTLREADRRRREDHFTLMEEEDEVKELEKQHDAMLKANKELEALVEAMKLETAAERARGKALKAKEDRLRQRLENELTEVRRLEKKRQATAEAKAAILAKREETKQLLLTLYENSRTRYEEDPQYPRYLELVETKRLLEEEIEGKEQTIEEQENTNKRMKEEEAEKWNEFVGICIRAAEIWKQDQEEKKKQKDLLLAQSQRLRLGLQTKKDSTFLTPGYSTAAPQFPANRLLGLSFSNSFLKKLPFFRQGNHQKTQESSLSLSGLYSPEKVRDENSKYDEAMKRLREMRLKSTKAPIPAKRPRPSETDIKSIMGRQFIQANVRTLDTTEDMETNTEGVSDRPSNEDMEIVEINTEPAVKENQSSTSVGYAVASKSPQWENKEAPSRAPSSGFDVSGGLVSETISVEAVCGDFQSFREPCSTNNTRPVFVRPQSRAGHEKAVLSSIENTVEKNAAILNSGDPTRASPLFRQPTPRFRSEAMEPPRPQFGVAFVPAMSTSKQAKGSVSTTTSGPGSLLQGKETYPSQAQSQRSNGTSSSIPSQAESVATSHLWNDDAGNGIEAGESIFQFDGNADNDFSFGGDLDMGNDDGNEPFSFSGEAFSSAEPFF